MGLSQTKRTLRRSFQSLIKRLPWSRATLTTSLEHDRFVFPAEDCLHRATILAFPSQKSLPSNLLEPVRSEILELANTIAKFEPVRLYARPEDVEVVRARIGQTDASISLIPFAVNHCWVRDTGPVYVYSAGQDRTQYAISFGFNEWGGKSPGTTSTADDGLEWGQHWPVYTQEELDENASFAARVIDSDDGPISRLKTQLTVEGGALTVDGEGTLAITESSIVCDVRNPGMTKAAIDSELKRLLGIQKIIWIPGLRNEDITDCHIDGVARFIRPGAMVVDRPPESQAHEWLKVFRDTIAILESETDAKGRKLELFIVDEPDVEPLMESENDEVVADYVNFYHVNGGVIVPGFGDKEKDQKALELMKTLFPSKEVTQVLISGLAKAGGGIHCVTQQIPLIN